MTMHGMTMRLVDTHCHIHDDVFSREGDDAAAAIARAHATGVELMLTLGVNRADSECAIALAERHGGVWAAVGVHPHDAKDATADDLDALEAMAAHPKVAMIGEIGLDFYRNLSPRGVQLDVMRRQLETARRVGKPVAVHTREAQDEMLPLLEAWSASMGGRLPDGRPLGVMHYFSVDAAQAARYVELGFVISIHTSVTHRKAALLQDVARTLPLDHLVLETDSPYGAPQRYRGKRNEPAYVLEAAAKVAELRDVTVEHVADVTTRSALRLLGVGVAIGSAAGEAR